MPRRLLGLVPAACAFLATGCGSDARAPDGGDAMGHEASPDGDVIVADAGPTDHAVVLNAMHPPAAQAGAPLTLEGGFAGGVTVRFAGGVEARAEVLGPARARVVVPTAAASGPLTVVTDGGA